MRKYAVYSKPDGTVFAVTPVGDNYDIDAKAKEMGEGYSAIRVDSYPAIQPLKIRRAVNGSIVFEDDAEAIEKKAKLEQGRASGIEKLRKIGLTDDEIKALIR